MRIQIVWFVQILTLAHVLLVRQDIMFSMVHARPHLHNALLVVSLVTILLSAPNVKSAITI